MYDRFIPGRDVASSPSDSGFSNPDSAWDRRGNRNGNAAESLFAEAFPGSVPLPVCGEVSSHPIPSHRTDGSGKVPKASGTPKFSSPSSLGLRKFPPKYSSLQLGFPSSPRHHFWLCLCFLSSIWSELSAFVLSGERRQAAHRFHFLPFARNPSSREKTTPSPSPVSPGVD